jgi:hypothetical protein
MIDIIKNLVEAESKRWVDYYIALLWNMDRVALLTQVWTTCNEELKILEKLWQLDMWLKYEQYSKLTPTEIYKLWQLSIIAELENIALTNGQKL